MSLPYYLVNLSNNVKILRVEDTEWYDYIYTENTDPWQYVQNQEDVNNKSVEQVLWVYITNNRNQKLKRK